MTPSTLYTYMTKYPAFGADLLKLLQYARELAQDPTDYMLIGKIGGRAAALGAALELHRSLCE
jgi:hypothetical protein